MAPFMSFFKTVKIIVIMYKEDINTIYHCFPTHAGCNKLFPWKETLSKNQTSLEPTNYMHRRASYGLRNSSSANRGKSVQSSGKMTDITSQADEDLS